MNFLQKFSFITTTCLILYSNQALGQWTKYYSLYEEADSSFNLDYESLTLFTWDSSSVGAIGSAFTNKTINWDRIKLGFYSQIEKADGSIIRSSASPKLIANRDLHFSEPQAIFPQLNLGFNTESILPSASFSRYYRFGCFKLGESGYLWQTRDTNQIIGKPIISPNDTLIWLLSYQNGNPDLFNKVRVSTGDTIFSVPYSAIAPKAHLSNNSEYRLTTIGENEDSLFFDFTYVDTASFNLLGYFKASKAILVYSKTSLSPLDSFFYFDYNQQKEMRAISTSGTKPLYFDLDYTLFPGPPKTAHQVISIKDWQRDSLATINFFSSYNYLNPSGRLHLPSLKLVKQEGFILLNTDYYYENPFMQGDINTANRLMLFDQGMNLKYDIASTGFDHDKYIRDLVIGHDGSIYFVGYENGQSYFYTFGMISPSGSHPWFSKFLNIEKEIAPEVDISLYPNPSNGKLTLANYSRGFENLTLTIFDIQGKFIENNIKPDFSGNLRLPAELSNGIYYLKVQGRDQTTKTFKVLLKR